EQLNDLLVWYYVQKQDFSSAFTQVKAIDKRNKENGDRIFQFAQSAYDEGNYDAALTAYKYLITEKGKNSMLYMPARTSELKTEKTKITIENVYTNQDLLQLQSDYNSYLNEFGRTSQTLVVMRDFAEVEAKYLHNIDSAISILRDAITINSQDLKL